MKIDDDQPVETSYFTLEEALKFVKQPKDEIPFPKAQPKRFTVHASADPSNKPSFLSSLSFNLLYLGNPYNEVIDYEDMDALNQGIEEATVTKKENSKSKSSSKKSSTSKPQQPTNQSNKRPALVVQQLPPPMLLPP